MSSLSLAAVHLRSSGCAALVPSFRGGGRHITEETMEDLLANDPLPNTHAESGLRVVSHLEFVYRTNMINISGTVEGQEYTAAWTLGDGIKHPEYNKQNR